jgi:chemotaxis signal transduction protein
MRELLLLSLDGLQYGVWTEEIVSHDVQVIHWLTTTARINYAISSINRQTLTLVDLAACLGLAPVHRERESRVLVIDQQEKGAGFIVEDSIGYLQVPSSAIFPVPPYLKTSVTDSCVVSGNELIPVINLFELHRSIQEPDFAPVKPECTLVAGLQDKAVASSLESIRLFACNGKPFAASSCNIQSQMAEPGSISGLALMPDHVRGIILYNERVLPVIDLAVQLEQTDRQTAEQMLIVEFSGQEFAFLVDSDIGILANEHFFVQPLPDVICSVWFSKAVIRNDRIIPIIDFLQLLLNFQQKKYLKDTIAGKELSGGSVFPDRFGREDVKVVEFQVSGVCHALPEMEVKDSIPFRPLREIPGADQIVAGVISHENVLLPVLDLARCFGRSSRPGREWRLLLVENGSFRIFIMAGTVPGQRILSRDMQRDLPFVLPHSVVYGCYPFESSVRLILNIRALTLHFDEERAREFFKAFSGGMEEPEVDRDRVPEPLKKKVEELFDSSEQVEDEEFVVTEYPELASVLAESEQLFFQDLVRQSQDEIEADELADREADKCAEKMLADAMAAYNAQVQEDSDKSGEEPELDSKSDPVPEAEESLQPETPPLSDPEQAAEPVPATESEADREQQSKIFAASGEEESEPADPEPELLSEQEKDEETAGYPDVTNFLDDEPVKIETEAWIKEIDRSITEKFDIDAFTSQVDAECPEPDEEELTEEEEIEAEEEASGGYSEPPAYDVLKDFPELHAFAERVAQEQEQEQELNFKQNESSDLLDEFSELLSVDLSRKYAPEISFADLEQTDKESGDESDLTDRKSPAWRYAALTLTLLALAYLYMSGMLEKWYQTLSNRQERVETGVPLNTASPLPLPEELKQSASVPAAIPELNQPDNDDQPVSAAAVEENDQSEEQPSEPVTPEPMADEPVQSMPEEPEPGVVSAADNDLPEKNLEISEPAAIADNDTGESAAVPEMVPAVAVTEEPEKSPVLTIAVPSAEPDTSGRKIADNDTMPVTDKQVTEEIIGSEAVEDKEQVVTVPDQVEEHPQKSVAEEPQAVADKAEVAEIEELADVFVYTVQEADNLWRIAEQYTGSGFNYIELAKENSIADPNLIVPEQKITIRKNMRNTAE